MNNSHQLDLLPISIHSFGPKPKLHFPLPSSTVSLSMDNSILNNSCTRTIILVALLLSLMSPGTINSIGTCLGSHATGYPEFRPVAAAAEPPVLEQLLLPEDGAGRGRRLGPFQLCLACKCCAAATPTPVCATMPCCFGIDCQLPNKPFGVCAFVPRSCNCTSCTV
ncbi:uncharacterized protein LOC115752489 [Rhodamnia argentea]|uniref:Uncharacterized protein LOC115752489 n=1 Tax=Rhodamnia argentea TaxID=178133 RepID=A0A8B8QJY2_9MYRT|nr:uncharacterized protein LOC115752489 [Rhodamnia argentea]